MTSDPCAWYLHFSCQVAIALDAPWKHQRFCMFVSGAGALPDQAALHNVRAVAASDLARSSARSVFARADVVLAWHSSGEDTHLVPLINEVRLSRTPV